MSRPENYTIVQTVWRSGRKNGFGDELVVAQGKIDDEPCYVMAWEVSQDRPMCIRTVRYSFPYALDRSYPNHIKIHNNPMEMIIT